MVSRAEPISLRLGSRVVSALDSSAEGSGFKSQSRRCRATVLGKVFTRVFPGEITTYKLHITRKNYNCTKFLHLSLFPLSSPLALEVGALLPLASFLPSLPLEVGPVNSARRGTLGQTLMFTPIVPLFTKQRNW